MKRKVSLMSEEELVMKAKRKVNVFRSEPSDI